MYPKKGRPQSFATDKAPAAIGPYSQAVAWAGLLFVSGQIPLDPESGTLVAGDIAAQAHQCMKNLAAIVEAAGTGMDRAVKFTVFLTDMGDFAAVNAVYAQYFEEVFPARSAVQVSALPRNAAIEIEGIFAC